MIQELEPVEFELSLEGVIAIKDKSPEEGKEG